MLLWQARRGTSYSINNLNEYTLVGGHAASYDNNGNVLSRYDASGTQWTYTYDAMNRLMNATNGATTRNFYYDGLDRQVARSGTALPATFSVWDGWDLYAEYGFQAAVGSPLRTTIHGAPGDLIQQNKSGFTNTNYYPDGLGSTAYLASGAGALLEQYTYDAYGTPTIYNASGTIIGASAYAADHFFTGRQWHAALGLYDNRHRFYAPDWGRFLQPDPIGFSGDPANLYRYCANNPVNWSDPYGLFNAGLFGRGVVNVAAGVISIGALTGAEGLSAGLATPAVVVFGTAAAYGTSKGAAQIVSSIWGDSQQQAGADAMPSNISTSIALMTPQVVGDSLQYAEDAFTLANAINAIKAGETTLSTLSDLVSASFNIGQKLAPPDKKDDPFANVHFGLGGGGANFGGGSSLLGVGTTIWGGEPWGVGVPDGKVEIDWKNVKAWKKG